MGPTACGKSDLAIRLAQKLADDRPVEIISVDSAMVYRGLDIGTAKPDIVERAGIPHHLIDIRDPLDPYSAADFLNDARQLVDDIVRKQRIPLLVGGTMLYFKALKDGIADLPPADDTIRRAIVEFASQNSWAAVHERLQVIDPVAAERIHPNDPQRLQRALEVYELTGQSLTTLQQAGRQRQGLAGSICQIAIVPSDREKLHMRIASRFKEMLANGLIEEVTCLFERGDLTASLPAIRSVGYRQVWQHLAGELSYSEMVELALVATRQLAKRQFTWLRSWKDLDILSAPLEEDALKILRSRSILS